MTTPINLNKARKARAKARKTSQSKENAAKFGRTKAEKAVEIEAKERHARIVDLHRRDDT